MAEAPRCQRKSTKAKEEMNGRHGKGWTHLTKAERCIERELPPVFGR